MSLWPIALRTSSLFAELVDANASSVETISLPSLEDGRRGWLASWSRLIFVMPADLAAIAIWSREGRGMLASRETRLPDLLEVLESK